MYLSSLLIDLGDNPDRPRPGRLWLRNLYHIHQRLCMAFPSDSRLSADPDFLQPFKQEEFGINQVHVKREADSGFLFRIDPKPGGRAVILVQSAVKPDWGYAFHNAYLLAASPEVKSFDHCFARGQSLRFRLVANPTRRLSERSPGADGMPIKEWNNERGKGKRFPVPDDRLFDWLARRAEPAGFTVKEDCTEIQPGYIYVNKKKTKEDKGQRLRSVCYNGVLQVTDPALFEKTIIQGLGSGKAFGFGLLSVAPCQNSLPVEAP